MTAGYVLSLILGTPKFLNARRYFEILCGRLAPKISAKYQDSEDGQHTAGAVYMLFVMLIAFVPALIILILLYCFVPALAIILDAVICWSVIDLKGVTDKAAIVARSLKRPPADRVLQTAEELSGVKLVLSEQDKNENEKNLVRSAVQGISDRTVDSSAASLLSMFLLSGAGGLLWCAVNTAAGYKYNDTAARESFSEPVRKLKDVLCFIPGKLAGYIMLVDALYLKLNVRAAERTMKHDAGKCRKKYFGMCRTISAGILGISLLPEEAYDDGLLRTCTIGEHLKDPDGNDIALMSNLFRGTSFIIMALLFVVKLTAGVWF